MHDLKRAQLILDAVVHEVLRRAGNPAAAGATLKKRIASELNFIQAAVQQAPQEKVSLQAKLEQHQAQVHKLTAIIASTGTSGRADLLEAAQERRETASMHLEMTRTVLADFDAVVAKSLQVARDLESKAYQLNLELQRLAGKPAPEAAAAPAAPAAPTAPARSPEAPAEDFDLDALLAADEAAAASPTAAAPAPAGRVAEAPADNFDLDALLAAENTAAAAPAPTPAAAEVASTTPAPQGDASAEEDEWAALMAEHGGDDAPASVAPEADDAGDLDDIMAGLTLGEVSPDDLPEGAAAELAAEDAQIAAASKKAGLPAPANAGKTAVPAVVTTAAVPATVPKTADKKALPAVKEKAKPPAKASGQKRRVWPWLVGTAVLGGGGVAAYVWLLPLL